MAAETKAWPDGTGVTVLAPHERAGVEGEVVDWQFAFASGNRRYWVLLDNDREPILIHEFELQRKEPT